MVTKSLVKSIIEQTFETSIEDGHSHNFKLDDEETSTNFGHSHKIKTTATQIKITNSGDPSHSHQVVGD